MSKVKKLKVMQPDGTLSEPVDIGADAKNVTLDDGDTLQDSVTKMKEDIKDLQSGMIGSETDPTVPEYVKQITEEDIQRWNESSIS